MTRDEFIKSEDKHVTVRIVSPDGVERPFNRLLNTIPGADGNSLVALEEDAAGAIAGMIVKLPEKVRRTVGKVSTADGFTTIDLQPDGPVAKSPKPVKQPVAPGEDPKPE